MNNPSNNYQAENITVLTSLEAIRKNPGMYIGSTDNDGAHHLFFELIYNAVDEALAGECCNIKVEINADTCTVEDDGRGIPTEIHPTIGRPACEVVLTHLHSGGKFESVSYSQTAGLHGVGLSCVNALSESVIVDIFRNNTHYHQEFGHGEVITELKEIGRTDKRGTRITFKPDKKIFKNFGQFDYDLCAIRLEELAYLFQKLKFEIHDIRNEKHDVFYFDEGIKGLLEKQNSKLNKLHDEPVLLSFTGEFGINFQAAVQWTSSFDCRIRSHVNTVNTIYGGEHVTSFKNAILDVLNQRLQEQGKVSGDQDNLLSLEEVCEGLTGVIDLRMNAPQFEGQTKGKLTSPEVSKVIYDESYKHIQETFNSRPKLYSIVTEKVLEARSARVAARRAHEKAFFKNVIRNIDEKIYKQQFGERSKNWHDSATWITDSDLLKEHASHCELGEDSIALDVCCGSGVVGASFRHKVKKIIGLDLTPEMVSLAKERLDEVHQGNVYNIPFEENKFDLVCTREVLHLLPYPERPVSEIYRVLKPGGQFIVGQILPFSGLDASWMYRVFKKKQPLIFNMFQEEDFRSMLLGAGFVDLKMTEMNVWESIDLWIDSVETSNLARHEIRDLFHNAPKEARDVHPFKILPNGEIHDLWRWCIFSVRKPH